MKWQGHGYIMRKISYSINVLLKNLKRIILKLSVKKWLGTGGAAVFNRNNNNLRFQNWHVAMRHSMGFDAVTITVPTRRSS